MPIRFPSYPKRPHATGQARIVYQRKTYYLGKHGTEDSLARYNKLIAQLAIGATPGGSATASAATPTNRSVSVYQLVDAHREWAATRYVKNGKPTSEIKSFKAALGPVAALYGSKPTDQFGPKALIECRAVLIARGYCRKRINQHVGRIRQVFKWGVAREMVSPMTLVGLQSVQGLRQGEDGAKDRKPIECVQADHVSAIKDHVLPPVWAMVQLQSLTGMRPAEVCSMRTCDVRASDASIPAELAGKCWVYRPASHKTEHHGRSRIIFLGPQAQQLLAAWLRPDHPERPIFSAREAVEWSRKARRSQAKNPPELRKRKANPKRVPTDRYTPHAYAHAIAIGCAAAGIPRWSPNRLRHNAATLVRQQFGAEASQVVLGHSHLKTAEIYAERDLAKAAKAIAMLG